MSSCIHWYKALLCYVILISSVNIIKQSDAGVTEMRGSVLYIENYDGLMQIDKMKEAEEVQIINSNVSYGDLQQVPVLKLKKLTVKNSHMTDIPEIVLISSPKLEVIIMDNVQIENMDLKKLNYHTELVTLHLEKIKLGDIKEKSFGKLKKLKCLNMTHAEITNINEHAFEGLDSLEHLNLNNNHLRTIDSKVLAPLKKLKVLDLRHNQFESFGPDNLPEMPELELIDLGSNPVAEVDVKGIQKNAPKLDDILVGVTD